MRLVVGSGVIGEAISSHWSEENISHHVSTRARGKANQHRPYIDLEKQITLSGSVRYSSAVLCAGISRLNECRDNPVGTNKVNVEGTLMLARYLAERGTRVVFISSDRVYDGKHPYRRPNDRVDPVTEYGRQKAETESGLLALPNSAVVRLTKVIYPNQRFLMDWVTDLEAGRIIKPFSDMWFAPISMKNVFEVVDQIIERELEGIWHVSSTYELTYQSAAYQTASMLDMNTDLIRPCSFLDNKIITNAEAPRYTALDMGKTLDLGVSPINPVETIQEVICLSGIEKKMLTRKDVRQK